MRVLVTGQRGYIGSVLAPFVAAAGHEVVGLDTDFYAGCDFGAGPVGFPSIGRDVRDVTAAHLDGVDAVIHLAALSNDPLGDLSPELTYDINLEGSLRLARAAREAGVRRFVFASSCSMYGASDAQDVLDEQAPLRPLTPYAESKVRAEEGLWQLVDDGFEVVSMRNATVYGASPRLRLDIVLNNLAGWAHTTGRVRLLSDGTSWRPLVHVEDVARVAALMLAAEPDVVQAQAFNVGSAAQNYLVRDLAAVLAGVTGCEVELADDASPDPRSYRVDFSKLEAAFPDFRFEWDAERGARELVEAYEREGMTTELFDGRLYVRLRQLRYLLDGGQLTDDLHWVGVDPAG